MRQPLIKRWVEIHRYPAITTKELCRMKCLSISGTEDNVRMSIREVPKPTAGPGEVLIEVWAAGVITTEIHWQPTWTTASGKQRLDAIPGHEFSGIVVAAGEGVEDFHAGDEVFGMNDWYADGAIAEYCVAKAADISLKPSNLTHGEAASVPISALTAWQGLIEHARLQAGETVLVHGGAGSVGAFVVQLAKLHGARVVATASARDENWVLGLGAERVLDYHALRFEDAVKDVDVVFDTVGGDTLRRSWKVLGSKGRLVTVAYTAADGSEDKRATDAAFIVNPSRTQLTQIASLFADGKLQTFLDRMVPLTQAPEVYAGRLEKQKPGKVVVQIRS
jgi:NADPH:quinone reductase-like Zn-dependent oxidoreductase